MAIDSNAPLGEADAARILGLGVSTLQKYRVSGAGPTFMKLGRAVRYDVRDLEEWKAARRVRSTSEVRTAA
ncbi:MAG: helix-turn-helix domain-containing protein [Sphingomonas adhaesiva]|uniref:helix-turn-helix transcriptional regulator n=1 Tax=Sphingomonas adhaesiva TaxID=28212 RepID=UPI002FF66225